MSAPLKRTEFVLYAVHFADGNDREYPFLRLFDMI